MKKKPDEENGNARSLSTQPAALPPSTLHSIPLTNDNLALFGEVVFRNFEVERGRSLSYAARDIVVRAMARAEPATKVAGLSNGNATEMGADALL